VRVLLDECVPRQLATELTGFDVRSVQEMGWAGVKNGALIELAGTAFDAIFTVDRQFGAAVPRPLPVAVVILEAGTTDPTLLRPFMPLVVAALKQISPGEVSRVESSRL